MNFLWKLQKEGEKHTKNILWIYGLQWKKYESGNKIFFCGRECANLWGENMRLIIWIYGYLSWAVHNAHLKMATTASVVIVVVIGINWN